MYLVGHVSSDTMVAAFVGDLIRTFHALNLIRSH